MPDELNPYAPPLGGQPPTAAPEGEPDARFSVRQGKGTATLSFYPGVLHLQPDDGKPGRSLDHRAFVEHGRLGFFFGSQSLVVGSPPPAVAVQLSPEGLSALRTWLTPALQEHLAKTLRGQRATAALLGVLWLLPAGAPSPSPFAVAFGVSWLAWALAVTLRPHRLLFLPAAVLWSIAGVLVALRAVHGSPLWWGLVVFFVPAFAMRIRSYRFYGPAT
jgi:hypothetical protein